MRSRTDPHRALIVMSGVKADSSTVLAAATSWAYGTPHLLSRDLSHYTCRTRVYQDPTKPVKDTREFHSSANTMSSPCQGQCWTGCQQKPPSFSGLTPSSIIEETKAILLSSRALRDRLVATISSAAASFHNVVVPLVDDSNAASCRLSILGHVLADNSLSPAIREASRQAQKIISAASSEQLMRKDVADLVHAVFQRSEASRDDSLDAQDLHCLRVLHGEMVRSGSTLQSGDLRERLQTAQQELQELKAAAQKTMSDSNGGELVPPK